MNILPHHTVGDVSTFWRSGWMARALASLSLALWCLLGMQGVARAADPNLVRIGYQKYGTLNVLRAQGFLEKTLRAEGKRVEWSLFTAGPQLLEALNAGSIDLGNTGEAPPIFAQAANPDLVYLGNQPPYPQGEGILVPKGSAITSVAGLKGKRIVLNKGSNVHFFLVKALEQAGVNYGDVQTKFLPPAEARAAFEGGAVDAWAIWDPFLAAARQTTGGRVLVTAEGLAANREFFLTTRAFLNAHPRLAETLAEAVNAAAAWATAKPGEVAQYLSKEVGIPAEILEPVIRGEPWGFQKVDAKVVADQQAIADLFFSLKLIPKSIDVSRAVPGTDVPVSK